MKNIVILLNIAALFFSVIWMISSKYDFEPTILTITFIATLIGLIGGKDFLTSSNSTTIIGNKNKIFHGNDKSTIAINKKNEIDIKGDENEVNQRN